MRTVKADSSWRCLKKLDSDYALSAFKTAMIEELGPMWSWVVLFMIPKIERFIYADEDFRKEIMSVAKVTGWSYNDVMIANIGYELAQASESSMAACTSAIWSINNRNVHARNLDWDLPLHGKEFIADFGKYKMVTWPGYIGALTGIRKGAYSISVNQAPTSKLPNLGAWSVGMLVRHVLRSCDTYTKAYRFLMDAQTIYPAFIHLAGVRKECTLFHTGAITKTYNGLKYITNHVPGCGGYADSVFRLKTIMKESPITPLDCGSAIKEASNDETVYSVLMMPKTGEIMTAFSCCACP